MDDSALANIPAQAPPPGVTSNFINPPSQRTAIIVLQTVFLFLSLSAVSIRVWVRTRIIKLWGAEDSEYCTALRIVG